MSTATLPTSRDGKMQITDSSWDCNGAFHVTVRELTGGGSQRDITNSLNRARRLAKKVDPMGLTKSVRLDQRDYAQDPDTPGGVIVTYRFTVSRLAL